MTDGVTTQALDPNSRVLPRVLRWEEPRPTSYPVTRRSAGMWSAVADELRANYGEWGVIYDGNKGHKNSLATHIMHGSIKAFGPTGDFEATTRSEGRRLIVYARYLGDGLLDL